MIRFCLIGAGRIGQVHANSLSQIADAKLVVVADISHKAAEKLANQYHAKVLSIDEAFACDMVDAFLIASSANTHADFLERCAKLQKPVFCEKPLDSDLLRASDCNTLIQETNTICMIGFQRRFDPHFAKLKQQIDAGVIGKLETLIITSRDPAPPSLEYMKNSGGIFRDMMIHDFDMASWLLGEEIDQISATASVLVVPDLKEIGDADTASATLTTKSGVIVMITNNRRATYGYDQRVEAFGSKGMLQVQNCPTSQVVLSNADAIQGEKPLFFFLERYADAYRLELIHFIESVKNNTSPSVSSEEGYLALRLAHATAQAFDTGKVINFS